MQLRAKLERILLFFTQRKSLYHFIKGSKDGINFIDSDEGNEYTACFFKFHADESDKADFYFFNLLNPSDLREQKEIIISLRSNFQK